MWNCAVNNWQGPHGSDAPGNVYYMTRCHDVANINMMPFDLIASIQRYDNFFSSLEFTILRLWDGNDAGNEGQQYCIRNKGADGVSYNTDCSDVYSPVPRNQVVSLGAFEIRWRFDGAYSKLYLNVLGDECDNDLVITTQTVTRNEEAVEIRVSDCYKEYTCGMCGNFYNTGLTFEIADGSTIELDEGCWGGTANDDTGLSYLVHPDVPHPRRMLVDEIGEPCFGLIDVIEVECHTQLRQWADCCWDRSGFCEEMIVSCSWDSCACVMGQGAGFNMSECVYSMLNASMSFVCGLGADSFVEPDMSIYENGGAEEDEDEDEPVECDEFEPAGFILLGAGISAAVLLVVCCFLYCFVLKPKMVGMVHFRAQVMNPTPTTEFDRDVEGMHKLKH
jgi:hypothetical protein